MIQIDTLYPGYPRPHGGVGYAAQSIAEGMAESGVRVRFSCVTVDREYRRPFHRLTIPPWAKRVGYRLWSESSLLRKTEERFLKSVEGSLAAYVWPGTSLQQFQALHDRAIPLVCEAINTHTANARRILDAEYARVGLPPSHTNTDSKIADENAKLRLADYVYCPCPIIAESMIREGIERQKVILTSYGLRPTDLFDIGATRLQRTGRVPTALFAGRIGVRKAVHLLLKYWAAANPPGRLLLVGNIEPAAESLVRPLLQRSDIEHIPYTTNLRAVYEQADMFLLPSVEEGSALVTYLALGAGLPCLVSPMGGGGIVDDGIEGEVIESHAEDQWVEAIQRMFADSDLRRHYSENCFRKAPQYLWSRVGKQRYDLLRQKLS